MWSDVEASDGDFSGKMGGIFGILCIQWTVSKDILDIVKDIVECCGSVGGFSWENGKSAATCLGISLLMQGGSVPSWYSATTSYTLFYH